MTLKIIGFFAEVQKETQKVSWIAKKEVISTSMIVVLVVIVASLFFLSVDMLVYNLVQYLLELGR